MWFYKPDSRTPTGRNSVKFYIAGILGLAFEWRSTRRSGVWTASFSAALRPEEVAASWSFRPGCSTGLLVEIAFLWRHRRLSPRRGFRVVGSSRDVLRRRATASTASPCGASCASRNEDVGEARARQHDETPNEGIERPAQRAATVRPVRREPAAVGRRCTDMVRPSGRGKKRADRPDETTDPGARGSRAAERGAGAGHDH